ncbi:MAG: PEP-CTERM sorting domain-containing protein, partial [Opitutales bacterium]|nr:PEP-CTERM sorting domain-containing protein [Opitutales bacterium]
SLGLVTSKEDVVAGKYGLFVEQWVESGDVHMSYATLIINVPEPSAFGLLAGVGALALVVSRRKRRFAE